MVLPDAWQRVFLPLALPLFDNAFFIASTSIILFDLLL
jgi:hypothetical protein